MAHRKNLANDQFGITMIAIFRSRLELIKEQSNSNIKRAEVFK